MWVFILSLFVLTSSQIIRKAPSVFSSSRLSLIACFKMNKAIIRIIINKIVCIIFSSIKLKRSCSAVLLFLFLFFLAIFVLNFCLFSVLRIKKWCSRSPFTAHFFKYCQRQSLKVPVFSFLIDYD